jgi:hypothetical protein
MLRASRVLGAAAVTVLLSAGCREDPTGPGPGEEFTLEPDERVLLPTAEAYVRFLRVPQDSRCPLQVVCVWLGDAEVVLELAPVHADAAEHALHTNGESGPRSVVLGRHELALVRLDPWPEVPGGVSPANYRAVLLLQERLQTTSAPD